MVQIKSSASQAYGPALLAENALSNHCSPSNALDLPLKQAARSQKPNTVCTVLQYLTSSPPFLYTVSQSTSSIFLNLRAKTTLKVPSNPGLLTHESSWRREEMKQGRVRYTTPFAEWKYLLPPG